jgi:hypothetical protein
VAPLVGMRFSSVLSQVIFWITFGKYSFSTSTPLPSSLPPRILFIQPSDSDYNQQSWERNLPYSLVELSQIDVLNYVQYHNYSYLRYKINEYESHDCHPVWSKVYALYHAMMTITSSSDPSLAEGTQEIQYKYDYIIVLDLDIFFMDYKQSILDKINQWDPLRQSLIYMPSDTDEDTSYLVPNGSDEEVLNVNTGFQIWKVSPITKEWIRQWKTCLERIPGCQKWKYEWPFDQGAFNEYIRPLIAQTNPATPTPEATPTAETTPTTTPIFDQSSQNLLTIIPCDEANGFPAEYENFIITQPDGRRHELGNHQCSGKFVSHFWEESKRYNHEKLQKFIFDKVMRQKLELIQQKHLVSLQEIEESGSW